MVVVGTARAAKVLDKADNSTLDNATKAVIVDVRDLEPILIWLNCDGLLLCLFHPRSGFHAADIRSARRYWWVFGCV